jgi:hypothetical protein
MIYSGKGGCMDEKKCKYCATMIPKDAKICPHCRKKLGWTWPAKIVLGLFVLGVIGSIVGKNEPTVKNESSRPATPIQAVQTSTPQPKFTLVTWGWETGAYGNHYIAGTIKNNTAETYRYAQVSFNLYDQSDAQVGSTMANINHLEPRGTWKFKAVVIEENAVKAKFNDISAF